MSKRLSVNEIKAIKRHRYIIKKLASLKLKKLRHVLENAPNELFRVLRLISGSSNIDIKALAKTRIRSFRKLLLAAVRYNESLSIGSR